MARLNEAWSAVRDPQHRPPAPSAQDHTPEPRPTNVTPPAAPVGVVATRPSHAGRWILAAVVVLGLVAAVVGVVVAGASRTSTPSPTTVVRGEPVWAVGSCVEGSGAIRPVSCSEPHVGKIVAQAQIPAACPGNADQYAADIHGIWCIDSGQ